MRGRTATAPQDAARRRWLTRLLPGRRPPPQRKSAVLLLCYAVDEHYLSHRLFPDATRLWINPGTSAARVLSKLPAGCEQVISAVNLTQPHRVLPEMPQLAAALAERGIPLRNAAVADHGKRALHARLAALGLPSAAAAREGPAEELLLVKAEHNSGAHIERSLTAEQRAVLGLGAIPAHVPDRDTYRVLPRGDLPSACLDDPFLAVERYLVHPEGLLYRLFLGGRHGALYLRRSTETVVRGTNSEMLAAWRVAATEAGWQLGAALMPPDALATKLPLNRVLATAGEVARDAGVEVGALDLVAAADGQVYLLDLNTTPYLDSFIDYEAMLRHLRAGLVQPQ